ncbi:uncharacterized protein LOC142564949 [Dermacentor variabilis]|uniref:uncharacterized protein LOC142564949 n=1 Tax=Dermacentor variabilis TaxID=34621 RepID=UPI003F5C809A
MLECYTYATMRQVPHTVPHLLGSKTMIKRSHFVEFHVSVDNYEVKVTLKLLLKNGGYEIDIPVHYTVLCAQEDCMVVAFGEEHNGRQQCILWGLAGDQDKSEQECFDTLNKQCMLEVHDVSQQNQPCLEFDEREKRFNRKAQEEQDAEQLAEQQAA